MISKVNVYLTVWIVEEDFMVNACQSGCNLHEFSFAFDKLILIFNNLFFLFFSGCFLLVYLHTYRRRRKKGNHYLSHIQKSQLIEGWLQLEGLLLLRNFWYDNYLGKKANHRSHQMQLLSSKDYFWSIIAMIQCNCCLRWIVSGRSKPVSGIS